jgi:hypothetical protein
MKWLRSHFQHGCQRLAGWFVAVFDALFYQVTTIFEMG